MPFSDASPYDKLNQLIAELPKFAQANDWAALASMAEQISGLLHTGKLGKPGLADRQVIEQSLQHIETCLHKAGPARDDIARLLKGFGVNLNSP